jgi:hypothetical protein
MHRAGFDFVAPYSFGRQNSPPADPINFSYLVQAMSQEQSGLTIAYFHDTNGEKIRWQLDHGLPQAAPFDLAAIEPSLGTREATWKYYFYTENIKRFFDTVPVARQFRPSGGRPVMFFYASNTALYINRHFLPELLVKIREWFQQDYGVNPFIILEGSWYVDYEGISNWPFLQSLIVAQADAFYNWAFVHNGYGVPGGGQVITHPVTGISVGTSGVGYQYGPAYRDRQNGQALTNDFNSIRNAHIRMVAAWLDFEENSQISRTIEYGYQYIDLVNSLINPTPILSQLDPGVLHNSQTTSLRFLGNGFVNGASVLYSPDGTNVYQVPATYVSPQELNIIVPANSVPAGNYYVAIRNPNGGQSTPLILAVQQP